MIRQYTSAKNLDRPNKPKNDFKVGNTVKIGFMTLKVLFQSDFRDRYRIYAWILESEKGVRYQFTPYYGLERL